MVCGSDDAVEVVKALVRVQGLQKPMKEVSPAKPCHDIPAHRGLKRRLRLLPVMQFTQFRRGTRAKN
jgi:hypothetical protein